MSCHCIRLFFKLMKLFVLFRMLTAFVQMNTTSFWFGVAWDLYPVEHEGTRALKIEVVVNLALWWQLIAPTIALVSSFWALGDRCGRRRRDAALPNSTDTSDTNVAAICTTRTGRRYHRPDSSCARNAVVFYTACAKCYPELHLREEERPIAVSDQVESAARRGL